MLGCPFWRKAVMVSQVCVCVCVRVRESERERRESVYITYTRTKITPTVVCVCVCGRCVCVCVCVCVFRSITRWWMCTGAFRSIAYLFLRTSPLSLGRCVRERLTRERLTDRDRDRQRDRDRETETETETATVCVCACVCVRESWAYALPTLHLLSSLIVSLCVTLLIAV